MRTASMAETQALGIFDTAAILVVMAAALGYLNHRVLGLPHAIGMTVIGTIAALCLVAADALVPSLGLGLAARGFLEKVDFPKALLQGMLSFLLFAGALHVNLEHLLSRRWMVALAATIGVVLSTVLVGLGFWLVSGWLGLDVPLLWCWVFGALISPTDPVAVVGILRSIGLPERLEARIVGESLFNDGVGVVVFSILLAAATGSDTFSLGHAAELFLVEAGGGVVLGLAVGGIGYAAMKRIDEHNIEVLITLAMVMGGYALAQALGVSGPVAMAVAGLLIGSHGIAHAMSERTATHLTNFWSLLDELLNSVLFLLIGLEAVTLIGDLAYVAAGIVMIAVVLAARALSIGGPMLMLGRLSPFREGTFPVLVWGGLRGAISIAMALSLQGTAHREEIVTVTFVVVIFSVVVQGLTMPRLARHFYRPMVRDQAADADRRRQ